LKEYFDILNGDEDDYLIVEDAGFGNPNQKPKIYLASEPPAAAPAFTFTSGGGATEQARNFIG
jgi:hypothetical protein